MINKKKLLDPSKVMFAHLANLTEDDIEINKLPNVNLRCTHGDWVVGEKSVDFNGTPVFLDLLDDESYGYLYFKNIFEAQIVISQMDEKPSFVVYAAPLTNLGIKKFCTIDELKAILNKGDLHFTYMDKGELEAGAYTKK